MLIVFARRCPKNFCPHHDMVVSTYPSTAVLPHGYRDVSSIHLMAKRTKMLPKGTDRKIIYMQRLHEPLYKTLPLEKHSFPKSWSLPNIHIYSLLAFGWSPCPCCSCEHAQRCFWVRGILQLSQQTPGKAVTWQKLLHISIIMPAAMVPAPQPIPLKPELHSSDLSRKLQALSLVVSSPTTTLKSLWPVLTGTTSSPVPRGSKTLKFARLYSDSSRR
ncbi:hypothetical protein BJ165DRAFT_894295 [Panaeolus papilionaceus]|nr:hypothetical protein BJ165DRAFT_894295 [Panaeolus papilionaceus]